MKKRKKGLTVDECVKKAREYILKYGMCLLIFDVKGSSNFPDGDQLISRLEFMMRDLNFKFGVFFLKKGFNFLWGDCSWVEINNAEIIPAIIKYQKENYLDIPVYWAVAKDRYAKEDWKRI